MASRIIIAIALSLLCGCYKYHDEIVDATMDDEMRAWLDKNGFMISSCSDNIDSTAIHIKKREYAKNGK